MDTPRELDAGRVEQIAAVALAAVRENYVRGPTSRERALEALNACAFVAAAVIAGTGDRAGRREARDFFMRALAQNIAELVENPPPPVGIA